MSGHGDEVLLENVRGEDLTLWGAIKDLGFIFWLFAALVGAPSIVSLAQTVFVDFRLTDLLQWLIDGYRDLLDLIAGLLEPLAIGLFEQIRGWLGFRLELQPHWQPLFVVLGIFISANTRSLWNDGYRKTTFLFAGFLIVSALLGSWTAGCISAQAAWWMQGIAAGAPILLLFLGMWASYAVATLLFGFGEGYRKPLTSYVMRGVGLSSLAFVLAAGLSQTRLVHAHAGLLVLFGGMFLYGAFWTWEGFRTRDVPEVRFGLRLTGGFLFAFLLIGIDLALGAGSLV